MTAFLHVRAETPHDLNRVAGTPQLVQKKHNILLTISENETLEVVS